MSSCVKTVNYPLVKVEEQKRKAIFQNALRQDYQVGRIDGCLVSAGIRADYFVSGEGKSILVELKGCDIDHACAQLMTAVEHKSVKPHLNAHVGFLVICSRYPSQSFSVQKAKVDAKKRYNAKLHVFTNQRQVNMAMF